MNNKTRKIIIMGLGNINNFGDNFILRCVEQLVNGIGKSTAEVVDFEPPMNVIRGGLYYFVLCCSKICPVRIIRYKLIFLAVKIRCEKMYKEKLEDATALIFGCGSFKYGTQKLWAYYSLAIEIAEALEIPVMFNAMNIQKYDEGDWRCCFLKEHANRECVKIITSRDGDFGAERLRNDYHIRKDILCAGAGDVAFWIPECYKVENRKANKTVGINLIDGSIFIRYGNSMTEEELLETYTYLLHKLDAKGISWELFTNGLPSDYNFGIKLLRRYGNENIRIRVPESDVDLINIIVSYEKILGARLHACISAYALDIPFIGFVWDEKLLYFAEMAELTEYFIEEDRLIGQELFSRIMELAPLNDKKKEVREMWKEKTYQYIRKFLENSV